MLQTTLPRHPCNPLILSILTITLLHSLPGYAAPDAGQTLRELQQLPETEPPRTEPELEISPELNPELNTTPPVDEANKPSAPAEDIRFMVKALRISGNSEIPTAELEALVADMTGAEHNLAELTVAAARITAHYRARGYVVARAYLPAQDIIDGVVSINIIEGHIATHRINNHSRLSDQRVEDFLERIPVGDVIKTGQIDRTLMLLSDTPGVGETRASLQPGASVGSSDLLVELKPGAAYSGNVSLDNYGNRYIGTYRLGGTLNINSPFKYGDQFNISALASDRDLAYGRVAYQFPIGSDGLRLGTAYATTRYRLGEEFAGLLAHGKAASGSVFAAYPFIRSQQSNLSGNFIWEQKRLTDNVDFTGMITVKRTRLMNLGVSGNHRDTFAGGALNSFDLSLALGRLNIESPLALAQDNNTIRSNGAFTRLSYHAERLQRLSASNQLLFALSGQQANKNLDSSEKFALGGANAVRAYPQGEGIGDQGYLFNLELRHNLTDAVQGTLFYDTGSITVNRNPFDPTAANSLSLSGAGAGINADLAGTLIKFALAWRTGGTLPASIPASAVHNPSVWLQAIEQF